MRTETFNQKLMELTEKIIHDDYRITRDEAIDLLQEDTFDLIYYAGKIRQHYKKDKIYACSIINAKSGSCSENCSFCAQSAHHNTGVATYPLIDKEKLIQTGLEMHATGATQYSFVTSGYKVTMQDMETLCSAGREVKEKTGISLCASLGMLDEEMASMLKESGISNYHHNLETARSYFPQICTTHDYEEDIQTIQLAKKAGLNVCSGGIIGLGESWEQRIELAFTLNELEVNSIPLNFLNPIPGTKLANQPLVKPLDALKTIALFRFINPTRHIGIAGGREITLGDLQSWIFNAGANGFMIGNYLTTSGRNIEDDINMIKSMELSYESI